MAKAMLSSILYNLFVQFVQEIEELAVSVKELVKKINGGTKF